MDRHCIRPKRWFNTQLVHRLYDTADIMGQNLTQHLVRHRHIGLTPHMVTKLGLDHRECRFHIGPLVIVPQELLPVEREVVKHLLPEPTRFAGMDALERNIRGGPIAGNHVRIVDAGIALIS